MDKQALRRQIREKKRAMTRQEICDASRRLAEQFFACDAYRNAKTLYGYLPYNQEVRTVPILQQALRDGSKNRKKQKLPRYCATALLVFSLNYFTEPAPSEFS